MPVSIDGKANVTVNPGSGTATLPPILGALIAYDLKVDGNGVLTINPDDPPSVASSAAALAAPSNANAGTVGSSALGSLVSGGLGVVPSSAPATPLSGSASNDAVFSLPLSFLLSGGQQTIGNNPSPAPASASTVGTANRLVRDSLSLGSGDGEAAPARASKNGQSPRSMTVAANSSNEQLLDELFSRLAEEA